MKVSTNGRSSRNSTRGAAAKAGKLAWLAAAAAPAVSGLWFHSVSAATTDTWSGGGADSNWMTVSNWSTTNAGGIPVAGDALVFGAGSQTTNNNNFTAGTSFSGLSFTTGAPAYVLGGNNIALTGTLIDNAASGTAETVNLAVASSSGLTLGSDGSISDSLTLNANDSFTTFSVLSNSGTATTADTLAIGTGDTISFSGAGVIGTAGTATTTANLTTSGAGNLNFTNTNNSNFNVGVSASTATSQATVNLSSLTSFTYSTGATGTGTFSVGVGVLARGTLTLANASGSTNSITAATVDVGDSYNGTTTGNNGGTSTLNLGGGTNVIDANTITIGHGKSPGIVQFVSGAASSASITIGGQAAGTSTANITLGTSSAATGSSTTSTLALAGHQATVRAGTVIAGNQAGATANSATGLVSFDTGTFNATAIELAVDASGANAAGPKGTFVLGGTAATSAATTTASGVLNVTSAFYLGDLLNTTGTGRTGTATFLIDGGTANIGANIVTNVGTGAIVGTTAATLSLSGGILNMQGNSIGTAAVPIGTVNLPGALTGSTVAALENLGGNGIYATAGNASAGGLNYSSPGTLILGGTNTYTGGTTIASGATLSVGGSITVGTATTLQGSLPVGDTVTDNGILSFNTTSANSVATVSGNGTLNQNGAGTTTLTGTSSFSGSTTINGGALVVNGSLTSSGISISGGILSGSGTVGAITLASGSIRPGATAADGTVGTLSAASLTTSGGDLHFDLGASTSDLLAISGAASFTGSTLSINLDGSPSLSSYIVLTAGSLSGVPTLTTTTIGRTNFAIDTPALSLNEIKIDVSGGPASLTWVGSNASGLWDTQTTTNWHNPGLAGAGANDLFYANDNVTFSDSASNFSVTLNSTVVPGSVVFSNATNAYTVSGTGSIAGTGGLIVSGGGSVTLNTVNTYSGNTTVTSGMLTISSTGAIASNNITVASGSTLTVASGGSINSTPNLTDNGTVNFNNAARSLGTLNGSGTINLNGTTLAVSGGGTFSGSLLDGASPGALNITGSTPLILSGNSAISGASSIGAGASLQLGSGSASGALGTGSIANSGTLTVNRSDSPAFSNPISGAGVLVENLTASTNTVTLSGALTYSGTTTLTSGSIQISGAHTESLSGVISGAGNVAVGDGTTATALTLSGTNTYTGNTIVNAGSTLKATNNASVGSLTSGVVNVNAGGTFDVGGQTVSNTANFAAKQFNIAGTGVGGVGALTNSSAVSQYGSFENIALTANASVGGTRFDIGRNGTGNTDVLNLGGYTLTTAMTGTNVFGIESHGTVTSGFIVVSTGSLDIEETAMVLDDGTSTITYDSGTNAQFYQNTGPDITRKLIFLGNNVIGGGNTNLSTVNSNMTLEGNVTFEGMTAGAPNATNPDPLTLNGNIVESGGSSSVTKLGPYTLTLAGSNNWSGGTNLQVGTLLLGAAAAVPNTGTVTIGAGTSAATLDLGGFSPTIGGLANSGTGTALVTNSGTTPATLTVAATAIGTSYGGVIQDGTGGSSLTVSSGSLTLTAANTYSGTTTVTGGTLTVATGGSIASTNTTVSPGAVINLGGTLTAAAPILNVIGTFNVTAGTSGILVQNLGTVNLASTGKLAVAAPGAHANRTLITTTALNLSGTTGAWQGLVDLASNDAIVHGGSLTNITDQLRQGFNNGLWTGTAGITSSVAAGYAASGSDVTALGVELNNDGTGNLLLSTFDGQAVSNTDVLIKYTYFGDADLSGTVNGSDYTLIDTGFNNQYTGWHNGDFNYDGVINGNDYTLIDNAYNNQTLGSLAVGGTAPENIIASNISEIASPASTSAVPEPASLGMLAIGGAGMLMRRRRR